MAKNQMRMPSGTAGITQYYDEYKSALSIRPEHVIVLTALVGILVIAMHLIGR